MITLYIFASIAIELAMFDTMAECRFAQERIQAQEWYSEFGTDCVDGSVQ